MLRKMDENKANMTRTLASIAALEADLDRVRQELFIIFTYSINPFHATGRYLHTLQIIGFLMFSGDLERD